MTTHIGWRRVVVNLMVVVSWPGYPAAGTGAG